MSPEVSSEGPLHVIEMKPNFRGDSQCTADSESVEGAYKCVQFSCWSVTRLKMKLRGQPGDVKSSELHVKDLDLKCRRKDIKTKTK